MKRFVAIGTILGMSFLVIPLALADTGSAHRTKQTLPIKLGSSGGSANDISNAFCCGGTLGSAVSCNGALHILSNNHVLGRSGSGTAGEDTLQPGLIDTGCRATNSNIVADFAGNLVPLGTGNVDAAISAARAGAVSSTGEILDIGVPCANPKNATVGMAVAKSGRTSGLTTGTIQAVNLNVSVRYQQGCGRGRQFTITYSNQVAITPGSFLVSGDSGSLMVTNDANHNPVGLLYAGSSSIAVANPVQDVINAFSSVCGGGGFSFVGNNCPASATVTLASSKGKRHGPPDSAIEHATKVKEKHTANLRAHPAVLGVGVGASDDDPDEAVIVVYVQEGREMDRPIPDRLDGVKVKVILTDPIVAK